MTLKVIGARQVAELLDPGTAQESQREAFTALAEGRGWQPEKIGGSHPDDPDTVFCYAARLNRTTGPVSKFGSVNAGNVARGLPSVHASIVLLDPDSGIPVALIDGTAVTEIRTAAASAVAADELARADSSTLLVLGCGVQGRQHVRALTRCRPFERIELWSPYPELTRAAAAELGTEGFTVHPVSAMAPALSGADVVVCATLATEPLFAAADIADGATIISIGSFEAGRREIGEDTLDRSTVVVDDIVTATSHCGPVVSYGVAAGSVGVGSLSLIELGDVITGRSVGRPDDAAVVSYLSVGLGIQDAAAAWAIYVRAVERGVGHDVDW